MEIFKRVTTALSVIIMVAGCLVFLLFHVSATGWKALSIPTGSMRPSMPPGSLVLVHSVPITSLKVGDVITYTNPRNYKTTITHRITETYIIGGRVPGFVTRGDANKIADEPIAAGSVVGKVIWHAPHVGTWLISSKSWLSISLLVYLPAILLSIEEVQRLGEYLRSLEPYRLREWEMNKTQELDRKTWKYATGAGLIILTVFIPTLITDRVSAAISGNKVAMTHNIISVAVSKNGGGGNKCSGNTTNNNNVNVNTSTTQTATSGNATVSGNTSGGSASSGNASNSNSTTVNINVTNCH